ncbi:hypothetical protein GCM10009000_055930 [Halobacterium noricense]
MSVREDPDEDGPQRRPLGDDGAGDLVEELVTLSPYGLRFHALCCAIDRIVILSIRELGRPDQECNVPGNAVECSVPDDLFETRERIYT